MAIASSLIYKSAIDGIEKLKQNNPDLSTLLENLNEYGELILLGGAVRDFAYNRTPRDLDIIVDSNLTNLDNVFYDFTHHKNRFGGYKVIVNDIELDIWSIQNNWVFREKILKTHVDNIPKGTFYNFDAISINLNTYYVNADRFIESINENELDITLDDDYVSLNPTPEVNIIRAFVINKYWGLQFSDRVINYINNWLTKTESPYELLIKAELKHYQERKLSFDDYKKFL